MHTCLHIQEVENMPIRVGIQTLYIKQGGVLRWNCKRRLNRATTLPNKAIAPIYWFDRTVTVYIYLSSITVTSHPL